MQVYISLLIHRKVKNMQTLIFFFSLFTHCIKVYVFVQKYFLHHWLLCTNGVSGVFGLLSCFRKIATEYDNTAIN